MAHALLGIDVGGTRMKGVAINPDGQVLAEAVVPTPQQETATQMGAAVGRLASALTARISLPIKAIGVVVPGLVDESRGIGVWSANLGWRDLDLIGTLQPHLAAPVVVGHDVRAGLLGEHRLGAAQGESNACFVPLGTGLAVALMCDGKVLRGGAWTGELGHVVLDPDGIECGCGRRGCAETLIGGAGLTKQWRTETGEEGDAEVIVRRAVARDPVAFRLWDRGIDALATVLAPILAATGIEHVVIGGGLSRAGDHLFNPLTERLGHMLGLAPFRIVPAALGDRAGSLGAAMLALDAASEDSP